MRHQKLPCTSARSASGEKKNNLALQMPLRASTDLMHSWIMIVTQRVKVSGTGLSAWVAAG